MDCVQLLEEIRSLIQATFIAFGGSSHRPPCEAMLIRDGFFCGRRFDSDGLHAIWFVEENEIKFYDRSGAILRVLELTPENLNFERRRAA